MCSMPKMSVFGAALVLISCISCSTVEIEQGISSENVKLTRLSKVDVDMIAENFVHTLSQLDGLSPIPTTIQMMVPTTPFGRALEKYVIDAGYGHQLVEGDMGQFFLRYRVERTETQVGYTRVFKLDISDVSLEREFQNLNGHLTPVSAMRISGRVANDVRLNDDNFRFNNPNQFESLVESKGGQALKQKPLAFKPSAKLVKNEKQEEDKPENQSRLQNVFEQKGSNYSRIFADYDDLAKQLLPFANDSYKISFRNYEEMRKVIDAFEPTTDILSVVGCSLGKTASVDSNAALAVSRTNRVKEALIRSNVDPTKIFDESCWGSDYWDEELPRRGVVLTHKRVKQAEAEEN